MRNRHGLRAWVFLGLVTVLTTAAAAAASPVAQLYAEIYPDDVVITDQESFDRATASATVYPDFEPDILTVNETSRFIATVVYDSADPPSGGVEAVVAFRNDASLTVTAGAAGLHPVSPTRQNLDQGFPWPGPGGGFALEWVWDVIPRAAGVLRVEFEIRPVLIFTNGDSTEGVKINEPVEVAVNVHPNQLAFDEIFVAAETNLEVTIPALSADVPTEVTAALPLNGHQDVVQASITLATAPGSAPAQIEARGTNASSQPGDSLMGTWLVTPTEDGVVNLVFTVALSAAAGDAALEDSVETFRSAIAGPSPKSFWENIESPFIWLLSAAGLAAAALPLADRVFGFRAKRVARRASNAAPPVDGDP